jgi:hypothetical protein
MSQMLGGHKFCTRCRKPIVWAKNDATGHWLPLDEKERIMFVIDPDGKARMVKVYENHLITCPNADEFRKSKPKVSTEGDPS